MGKTLVFMYLRTVLRPTFNNPAQLSKSTLSQSFGPLYHIYKADHMSPFFENDTIRPVIVPTLGPLTFFRELFGSGVRLDLCLSLISTMLLQRLRTT